MYINADTNQSPCWDRHKNVGNSNSEKLLKKLIVYIGDLIKQIIHLLNIKYIRAYKTRQSEKLFTLFSMKSPYFSLRLRFCHPISFGVK